MATINLGRVKPVFRGAYNASTAYVIDDIVTYQNETYIAITATTGNLPTVTANWTKLAAKGTDGTDVGTTLTTQGDILYRDGSGLQRLGAGTSGYFLKTQGTGANPVWAEAGGGLVQVVSNTTATATTVSGNSYGATALSLNITPTSSSNKIFVVAHGSLDNNQSTRQAFGTLYRDSTNLGGSGGLNHNYGESSRIITDGSFTWLDTPNTTSQITYAVYVKSNSASGSVEFNGQGAYASITAMEVSV